MIALDNETEDWCADNGVNVLRLELQVHKAQAKMKNAAAISALKFGILRQFLDIGWRVLLSDVDIVILKVWECGRGEITLL